MTRGAARPTICLCMIVRDEAHVIHETIASVAALVDTWVVVDTGSSDGTLGVVRSEFGARGLPGETFERPWVDFGSNRTEALRLCGTRADYIWMIDADDIVVGHVDLSKLTLDSYFLRFGSGFRFWRKQIFRSRLPWEYRGVVHEYPACSEPGSTEGRVEGAYHIESRQLGSRSRKPGKFERDARLLRDALEADPSNERYVFYLAQSEFDAGDKPAALAAYERRAAMGGFEEEVFYSLLRIGECHEHLGAPWEKALDAYLRAWQRRPRRAEPLHRIASHYRARGEYDLAELFARRAKAIPFPEGDILFVSADVYDWKIDDELAICASWLGRHRESFDLSNRLLEVPGMPEDDRERVLANRGFPASHVSNEAVAHPEATIRRLTERLRKGGGDRSVTLSITSCRRRDLFEKTVDSFVECCEDLDRIGRFICVDDGSSDADRRRMEERYPFFEFVLKGGPEKGHARSMNMLLDIIESPFWLHLEDDWQFHVRDRYVEKALAILDDDPRIAQVLFNRNYAETWSCRAIQGGVVRRTSREGLRYRLHEHHSEEQGRLPPGALSNAWWPHYSLRPSLIRMKAIRAVGRYDESSDHFELEYANRWAAGGRVSAFFDSINCLHIGTLTSDRGERRRPNAYDLNGERQFRRPGRGASVRVKLVANFLSSVELCALWGRQSKGGGTWDDVEVVAEDEDVDYWVVINHPRVEDARLRKDRTIVFQMEPSRAVARWGEWAKPDPREFLQVRTHDHTLNNLEWHLGATWEELSNRPITKTRVLSAVTSGKLEEPGHDLRIGFLRHLEESLTPIDIFGYDNPHGFTSYRGALPPHDKKEGILPYRYTIAVENNAETNYVTEKIVDAILGECLCFYWGCPNLEEYFDPEAFVRLPLEDLEKSRRIIEKSIRDDERGRRLGAIRREKRRILDEYQFFPTVARVIHGHRFAERLAVRVVNLDRRPDRWESFRESVRLTAGEGFLSRCERASAVDGSSLAMTPDIRHLFRGNGFGYRRGIVACALSHLAIWKEAARQRVACLVFEDDARLCTNFTGQLVDLCGHLADSHSGFDLALLGYQLWDRRFDPVFHSERVATRLFPMQWERFLGGSYGYIVSPDGARRLLALVERDGVQIAIDWFLMRNGVDLKVLQAFPQIVKAPLAIPGSTVDSDIQHDFASVPLLSPSR